MTLVPYPPERLDALALELLDVAATLRNMAENSRAAGHRGLRLNGRKASLWLRSLELWAAHGAARLEAELLRARGARRAAELLPGAVPARPEKTRGKKKRTRA